MLSKIISFPFAIGLFTVIYLIWERGTHYAIYMVPFIVMLAVIYVLSPQIDWWWYKRRPPEIYPQLKQMFSQRLPFYKKLSPRNKQRFEHRVMMYMLANEFMPQLMESVPMDIEAIAAANVVQLTFGVKDYRMSKFEHIVICPGPFPSPQYPEHTHVSEIYAEDKSILFSMDHLVHGTINAKKNYNIGMHEYARVFLRCHPNKSYPTLPDDIWQQLETISGFTETYIRQHIGRPDVKALPTSMVLFFIFPEKFKAQLPEIYTSFTEVFNLSPVDGMEPIVNREVMGLDVS